ncbi:hypothetical protein M758_8G050000 [Ceratodon purpureus]|nr:hypothetical protein M758_8G050000 [Ceratodon purpureus]
MLSLYALLGSMSLTNVALRVVQIVSNGCENRNCGGLLFKGTMSSVLAGPVELFIK